MNKDTYTRFDVLALIIPFVIGMGFMTLFRRIHWPSVGTENDAINSVVYSGTAAFLGMLLLCIMVILAKRNHWKVNQAYVIFVLPLMWAVPRIVQSITLAIQSNFFTRDIAFDKTDKAMLETNHYVYLAVIIVILYLFKVYKTSKISNPQTA